MTSSDTEQAGVNVLSDLYIRTKYIKPYFTYADKKECWDGYLLICDNVNKTKGEAVRRINVQIKTETNNDLSKKSISYEADKSDLTSYLLDDGCLYFVIYKNDKFERKIYYASLLPSKIVNIFRNSTGKKNISIHLDVLPSDPSEVEAITMTHYTNKQMQFKLMYDKTITMKDLKDVPDIKGICIPFVLPSYSDPFEFIVKNDLTKYVYTENREYPIPVEGDSSKKIITVNRDINVCNDDVVYYNSIKQVYTEKGVTTNIGKCVSLNMNFADKSEQHVTIIKAKTLNDVVDDLPFIISIYKNGSFHLGKIKIHINVPQNKDNQLYFEALENNLNIALKFKELLKHLNIKKDIVLEELTKEEWKIFWYLYNGLIMNKKYIINKEKFNSLNRIKIRDINIIIANIPNDDTTYEIRNVFRTNISVYQKEKDEKRIVSQFCVFDVKDFYNVDNIDYEFIIKSIMDNTYDDYTADIANELLLKLLNAYDICKNQTIIQCVLKLSRWLVKFDKKCVYYLLNYYQILKRLGKIATKDKRYIKYLINHSKSGEEDIVFACYVLLDDLDNANLMFDKLEIDESEKLKQYPIYSLFNELSKQ